MTAKFEVGRKYLLSYSSRPLDDYVVVVSRTNKTVTVQHCREKTVHRVKVRDIPNYGEMVRRSDRYSSFFAGTEKID